MKWLAVALMPAYALASIHQLTDARPTLGVTSATPWPAQGWDWSSAGAAFTLANTEAIRVNFRGLHTFATHRRLRPLKQLGWVSTACNASAWALCSSDVGDVLPSHPPRVSETPGSVPPDWARLACTDNSGKVLVSEGAYDISACDIIDEGLDVVYSDRQVFHSTTAVPLWRYWVCVGLAIALVRTLSHNVQDTWAAHASHPSLSQRNPVAASAALVVLVLVDGDAVYVTYADQLFFWASVAYVGFYLVVHTVVATGWAATHPGAQPECAVFNVIIGTLQILATRLYTAAETPYNLVLMFMLACRAWSKLAMPPDAPGWRSLGFTLDALYLSLAVELAYTGTDELLVAIFGAAYVAARIVSLPEKRTQNVI